MINQVVTFSIRHKWLTVIAALLIVVFGVYSYRQLALEAYPDIADVTSQVITQYPGHAAEEVEEQITIPLERELNGIPFLQVMRSKSTFGLSMITLVFRDGAESYFSRQRILERIGNINLPPGAEAGLDPLTSPIGEIYRYTLDSDRYDQRQLKELQQWVVVPRLKQVFGVADVTNFGGETTQFQVQLDPNKLTQYGLSLDQVVQAIQTNNANAGGSVMVRGDLGYVVRGIGLVRSLDDLGHVVITESHGTPVLLKDLGTLTLGALERKGVCGKDERPDVVSGIVLLLKGENPSRVLEGVHAAVAELNAGGLPNGVRVVPYLDRTGLVETTVHTVLHTTMEGIGLIIIVLLLFLGRLRSTLIVATTIPLALLIAFILMLRTDIPANLLSLGAIDFGIITEGAIVMMEGILRVREHRQGDLSPDDVRTPALQVARPIFFSSLIIITAYLPLFAFERVERKLFTPMAYTVGYALVGALLVSLTLIPALSYVAFHKPFRPFHNRWLDWLSERYEAGITRLVERPRSVLVPSVLMLVAAVGLTIAVGKDFLPELDEGSIWLQVQLPPGLSLAKASMMANELRRLTRQSPEVSYMVTQLGRNDDGTDPWTPSHLECSVGLIPYDQWPKGKTKHDLIRELAERYRLLAGATVGFSQPMIDGVNDKISGAHSDLVVKVYGDDFAATRNLATRIVTTLQNVKGAADVAIDQEPPLPQLQIIVDRDAAARYGVNVGAIEQLIETAIGGAKVSAVFLGERRYDVAVRYPERFRNSPEQIANLLVATPGGAKVPLSQLARIVTTTGESTITREMNHRHLTVKLNLRGRDLSDFLAAAQQAIAQSVPYDHDRYRIVWGGQFENQQRAQGRLGLIVPAVLGLMFMLLYVAFGTARHAGLVLAVVPLALLGGMVGLHLRGMTLNVSSAVGFIALFGFAIQNGVILLARINQLQQEGWSVAESVRQGTAERFRPVLMAATVAILGLLPASMAHGIGSDVQRPLATVIVFGLFIATGLTLFVLPAWYVLVESRAGDPDQSAGKTSVVGTGIAVFVCLLLAPPAWSQAVEPSPRPVSLTDYLSRVMEANLGAAAKRLGVPIAEADIAISGLLPNPVVTAGNVSGDVSSQQLQQQWYAGVVQTVQAWGKRESRIAVAQARLDVAQAQLVDHLRSLRGEAARAFVNVLVQQRRVEHQRRAYAELQDLMRLNQTRLRAGDISESELRQSRIEATVGQGALITAESALNVATLALNPFLGVDAAAPTLAPNGTLDVPPPQDRCSDSDQHGPDASCRRPGCPVLGSCRRVVDSSCPNQSGRRCGRHLGHELLLGSNQ